MVDDDQKTHKQRRPFTIALSCFTKIPIKFIILFIQYKEYLCSLKKSKYIFPKMFVIIFYLLLFHQTTLPRPLP
jgi:hypothetical protein